MAKKTQLEREAEAVAEIEAKIAEEVAAQEAAAVTPPAPENQPQETPTETPAAPVADIPKTPDTLPEINVWEQRYKSLEGKYRAEVPRLHAEIKELGQKLEQTTRETPKDDHITETSVSPEDVENYGQDLIDLIQRQAKATSASLQSRLDQLAQENAQLKQQLSGVSESVASTTQQTVLTQLAKYVPNWEQVNVDPEFIKWLADFDQMSGSTRQDLLNAAFEAGDAHRLGVIFQAYLKTKPQAPATPKPNPLEKQVAPGNSRNGSQIPNANPHERIWKAEDIAAFYDEARTGNNYSPDEIRKIEKEIDLAVAEGRVKM